VAKAIMIQGTMSGSGKSLLTAALCRIFRQDGYRVAPFKSQNMALNSFITKEGLEMGRAQVMQAEAAGIEPSVLMNPILLKPTTDCGSQVIVNGKPMATMSAREYFRQKRDLLPVIQASFDELSAQNDIIVIEGAGSPAEINLKQDDIVNMGMAKLAHAPVLLVGDIDRGGVFASLYGTVALLEPDERRLIRGLIINKFRGDETLLTPGYPMLEKLTQITVLGSIPMMPLDLEEEDSVSDRLEAPSKAGILKLAVIRLPRISNFTDFHALEQIDGVSVTYVTQPNEVANPDAILLPGSKNTISDLMWMRQNGLEAWIKKQADQETPVIGICGGYQMLGEWIHDPDHQEAGGSIRGLGLLPITTTFYSEKMRTQTTGIVFNLEGMFAPLTGNTVIGYQIHQGRTVGTKEQAHPFLSLSDGTLDGCVEGSVLGTYLHGLFDSTDFCQAFLSMLLVRKGLSKTALAALDYHAEKERQYNLLADTVRKHLDLNQIYSILWEGVDVCKD
jgi:adenosylcobyric acid synthase